MARLHVLGQQPVCLAGAVLDRISTRDAEGVEAVQIAAGGQDLGRAQQVPARGGAQEAAVEGMQDAVDLVVGLHQLVHVGQLLQQRAVVSGLWRGGHAMGDQGFNHTALWLGTV